MDTYCGFCHKWWYQDQTVNLERSHNHSHSHSHTVEIKKSNKNVFLIGIGLNMAFVVAEAIAGFAFDSMALLTDAGHNNGCTLSNPSQ